MIEHHGGSSEEARAWAALYVLGALVGDEKATFEEHLRQGCETCQREIQSLEPVRDGLALSARPADPPARVRQRLLGALGNAASSRPFVSPGILLQQPGLLISRPLDMEWEKVAPGIHRKLLFLDKKRDYATSLLRVDAGTHYPSHRHADVEEILVLEGDLHLHGVVMGPGDYCRAEPESIHLETYSESGCLLLQLTSLHDEVRA
jgi:anti-sigma factor ChrR (cupin superfamily)